MPDEERDRQSSRQIRSAIGSDPANRIGDEWNDELLDLIRVLTVTTELAPKQKDLLERITTGSLIKIPNYHPAHE
ncbi:hypothetical protein GS909_18640 [Rhodococcus hoagii]|nr:hypothetical protein [Prescottella equi]